MTSIGICKTDEFKDATFFKAICGCSSDKHIQTLVLENADGIISLHIYAEATSASWLSYSETPTEYVVNFFKELKYRLKSALCIIRTGYLKSDTDFIFKDEKSVQEYINALSSELERIKNVPRD